MANDLAIPTLGDIAATGSGFTLPAAIADQGDKAAERFFTFFTDISPTPTPAPPTTATPCASSPGRTPRPGPARHQELPRLRLPGRTGGRATPPPPSSSTCQPCGCCSTG